MNAATLVARFPGLTQTSPSATLDQVRAARVQRAATDPVHLARACGVIPEEWQVRLLRSTATQIVMCCSRQAGKSLTTALIALWEALYHAPALVLLLSPGERQSAELFLKVAGFYSRLAGLPGVPKRLDDNATQMGLDNGSRILSLPGSEATIRGYSNARLLVIDEAARVPDPLYDAVRPMLAVSRGRIILLSTPHGKRGFFWQVWDRWSGWERVQVRADECPHISVGWLVTEQAQVDSYVFDEEYRCVFHDPLDQPFLGADIQAAIVPDMVVERFRD